MKRLTGCTVLVAGILAAYPAWADFRAINGLRVFQINEEVFEVVDRGSYTFESFWCSAGDYAQRKLGLPWQTDLYVSRGLGPSEATNRRSAVQFSANPEAIQETDSKNRFSIIATGKSRSVTQARGDCDALVVIRP